MVEGGILFVKNGVVRCLFLPFVGNLFFISTLFKVKRQSFSFSVQNVEVVVNERDLGTDIHDAKRRVTALYQVGTTSLECPKFSSA